MIPGVVKQKQHGIKPNKYVSFCYFAAGRAARRGTKRAQLTNVAAAQERMHSAKPLLRKLPAASPLKFTTKTNVAVAAEIMRSARVAFLSAAENGADQNNL